MVLSRPTKNLLTPPSEQEFEQDDAPESNDDFFADLNAVADLPDLVWPNALRSGTTTQNELLAFVNTRNVLKTTAPQPAAYRPASTT